MAISGRQIQCLFGTIVNIKINDGGFKLLKVSFGILNSNSHLLVTI